MEISGSNGRDEELEAFFEEIKTILIEKFFEGLSEEEHQKPLRVPDMR